jgi:hypothetical protein
MGRKDPDCFATDFDIYAIENRWHFQNHLSEGGIFGKNKIRQFRMVSHEIAKQTSK